MLELNKNTSGLYNFTFVLIVAMLAMSMMFLFESRNCHADIIQDSYPVAKYIAEHTQGSCKEMNLRLYWWLRSKGYYPLVQLGTKEGQGHLWLELDGKILDATDWRYHGKGAIDNKDIYVLKNDTMGEK